MGIKKRSKRLYKDLNRMQLFDNHVLFLRTSQEVFKEKLRILLYSEHVSTFFFSFFFSPLGNNYIRTQYQLAYESSTQKLDFSGQV